MEENVESPHSLDIEAIIEKLDSNTKGLSDSEAKSRLDKHGPNELKEGQKIAVLHILFNQFKSWLVLILIVAAIISWVAGQTIDFWVITVVIFVNAAIGFTQEFRAEKAIAALQKMLVKKSTVVRDGELKTINSSELPEILSN